MLPTWLKRSPLGLSVFCGIISWTGLAIVWTHVADGGSLQRTIDVVYLPAYRAGRSVGGLVFGNASPHTTGWYLLPLFGAAGQLVFLIIVWYFGIRLYRVFNPLTAEEPVVPQRVHGRTPQMARSQWENEPDYVPKSYFGLGRLGGIFGAIDYERFKLRTWRQFREVTGSWPLLSICFHYSALVGAVVGAVVFFWLRDERQWTDGRSFAIGVPVAIVYVVFVVMGDKLARKADWRLFGSSVHPNPDRS
jgi:hypothetical protein